MHKFATSFAGPLMIVGLVFGAPAEAEVLVGIADTFSGPAGWGFNVQRSVELAADELNVAGGLLGEPVRVIWTDDACNADQAVAAARKLVDAGVVFVIGHSCSHAAIPASKVYEEASVLYFAPSATNPKLTDDGGPNVFRLRGRDDQVAKLVAAYLAKYWSDKRIAIIHDDRVYGWYLGETVRQLLNGHDIKEAAYDTVAAGQLEYSALVKKLQDKGIEIVFFGGYPYEAGLFIRQARERGASFALLGGDALADEEFELIAGPAAEGTLFTSYPDPPPTDPQMVHFVSKYREEFPAEPANVEMSPISYMAFQVWAEAVRIAGSFETETVAAVLHNHKFETMLGRIGFDDKGDVTGYEPWIWWVWTNRQAVPVGPGKLPPKD